MDIDEKRLDASYTLCMRLAKQMGIRLNISKTTSREEALTGADFVVNTILIGGYRGWKEGWSIAKKWGYRMGGSMHIMHDEAFWINFYQLRMIEDVQRDIKRICPNAWYLPVSYTHLDVYKRQPQYLSTLFRKQTGHTIIEFLNITRIKTVSYTHLQSRHGFFKFRPVEEGKRLREALRFNRKRIFDNSH